MVDAIRRLEYMWLKDPASPAYRPNLTHYVQTVLQSCQHHDSNITDVLHSATDRQTDEAGANNQADNPLDGGLVSVVRGNNKRESVTRNVVRWLVKGLGRDPEYRAWAGDEYDDWGGVPTIKMARFWSVLKVTSSPSSPRRASARAHARL